MWTRLRLQQPTSDLLTVWPCDVHCLLQESEGHRLTGVLHASRTNPRQKPHPTPPPGSLNHHAPSNNMDTTGLVFAVMRIWAKRRGAVNAGSILYFLWVSVSGSNNGLLMYRGTALWDFLITETTARGRMANHEWSYCAWFRLLYFYLENKKKKNHTRTS